jgi:hypothetical protein
MRKVEKREDEKGREGKEEKGIEEKRREKEIKIFKKLQARTGSILNIVQSPRLLGPKAILGHVLN